MENKGGSDRPDSTETHLSVQQRILRARDVALGREEHPEDTPLPPRERSDTHDLSHPHTASKRDVKAGLAVCQGKHSLEEQALLRVDRGLGRGGEGGFVLELLGGFAKAALHAVVVDVYVKPTVLCARRRGRGL